jgi:hypothetical protein
LIIYIEKKENCCNIRLKKGILILFKTEINMKKGNYQIYYEKKGPKKKNPWKSLLKNLLLMNTIALVVYVVIICLDDEINAGHHFLFN